MGGQGSGFKLSSGRSAPDSRRVTLNMSASEHALLVRAAGGVAPAVWARDAVLRESMRVVGVVEDAQPTHGAYGEMDVRSEMNRPNASNSAPQERKPRAEFIIDDDD